MIRVKLANGVTIECDSAAEAAEVVKKTTYTSGEMDAITKAMCKLGRHTPAEGDENHAECCGKCLHAGMC